MSSPCLRSIVLLVTALFLAPLAAWSDPPRQDYESGSSELGQVLSAAYGDYLEEGDDYARLHFKYLGVTIDRPDGGEHPEWIAYGEITPDGTLDRVLQEGVVRLGYLEEYPVHYDDEKGLHTGFEYELGEELVRRVNEHYPEADIRAEWVRIEARIPEGPLKNPTMFEVQREGLQEGRYDVAFTSLEPESDPGVAYLYPTMTMFPGVIYTGKDGLDVSDIQGRDMLVEFLAEHPDLTMSHGLGADVFNNLARDVEARGGSLEAYGDFDPQQPMELLFRDVHFLMGDIMGTAKFQGKAGVVLDVNPRLDFAPKSAFTLADGP